VRPATPSSTTRSLPASVAGSTAGPTATSRRRDHQPSAEPKPLTDVLGVDEQTVDKVLASWGPGQFDAVLFFDGAFRPDGHPAATLIRRRSGSPVSTCDVYRLGLVTCWNALVANLEMHGRGNFATTGSTTRSSSGGCEEPLRACPEPPRSGAAKLPALHFYQLALPHRSRQGSFDAAAAPRSSGLRGKATARTATCSRSARSPVGTSSSRRTSASTFTANRSPTRAIPDDAARGTLYRSKGGHYDSRFPALASVVDTTTAASPKRRPPEAGLALATAAAMLSSKLATEDTPLTAPERALMQQWLTTLADTSVAR
jgi:hypothetical protein